MNSIKIHSYVIHLLSVDAVGRNREESEDVDMAAKSHERIGTRPFYFFRRL